MYKIKQWFIGEQIEQWFMDGTCPRLYKQNGTVYFIHGLFVQRDENDDILKKVCICVLSFT